MPKVGRLPTNQEDVLLLAAGIMGALERKGWSCFLSGSREIGGHTKYSDIDIVVYDDTSIASPMSYLDGYYDDVEFTYGGSTDGDTNSESWKSGYINLIVVFSKEEYAKWEYCTKLAKGLELWSKDYRVGLFEYFKGTKVEDAPF